MKTYLTPEDVEKQIDQERRKVTSMMRKSELMEENIVGMRSMNDPLLKEAISELRTEARRLRIQARNKIDKKIPKLSQALAAIRTPSLFDGKQFQVRV